MVKLVLERLRSKYFGECISKPSSLYEVGSLVNVANRTWRGINKEGGVGRIIAINDVENTVDVKYVLSGTEKNIDLHYVEFHKFLQGDNDKKNDDSTGRGSRRITRRAITATVKKPDKKEKPISEKSTYKTPLRGKDKSKAEQVHTTTMETTEERYRRKKLKKERSKRKKSKKKKSKKEKLSKLTEKYSDRMLEASASSISPNVVTPDKKREKKLKNRFSGQEPKDSPVSVAASMNDNILKKNKKIQKRKLPVETEDSSKVINAEIVDSTLRIDGNITERIPKKQKTMETTNSNSEPNIGEDKDSLSLANEALPRKLNRVPTIRITIPRRHEMKKKSIQQDTKIGYPTEESESSQSEAGDKTDEEDLLRYSPPISISSKKLSTLKPNEVHDIRWY